MWEKRFSCLNWTKYINYYAGRHWASSWVFLFLTYLILLLLQMGTFLSVILLSLSLFSIGLSFPNLSRSAYLGTLWIGRLEFQVFLLEVCLLGLGSCYASLWWIFYYFLSILGIGWMRSSLLESELAYIFSWRCMGIQKQRPYI